MRLPGVTKKTLYMYKQVGMKMMDPSYYAFIGSKSVENSSRWLRYICDMTQEKMQYLK
jgi:hypothetical protein